MFLHSKPQRDRSQGSNKNQEEVSDMHRQQPLRWMIVLFFTLLPALSYADRDYDRMVVFGDSLSDPGNAYYLLGTALTPPYETLDALLVPDAPYSIGGHHFSDGPTWIEQLARALELKASARPVFASSSNGHNRNSNYAVGGARARNNGGGFDFTDQVNIYLSQTSGIQEMRTLTVIEFGGNDVRDAIAAFAVDPSGGASAMILTEALTAISDNILSLYAHGNRKLLISNIPDLSLTPAIRTLDLLSPGSALGAAMISVQFNAGLDGLIAQLQAQLPDLTITKFDLYQGLQDIVSNPQRYGLGNATDACVMPDIAPYRCQIPDHYFFWDGMHPTKRGHAIFAQFACSALFPEEDEWKSHHCRREHCRREACRR
jgi:phospholipase/lecithinase/hemolysin